jgi:hypothetical protein
VVVVSACGPTEGAVVDFSAVEDGLVAASVGDLAGAGSTLSITTDPDGRASCVWQLDATGETSQRVEVKLASAPDGLLEEPTTACFTGRLSVAAEVAYAATCEHLAGADTVQDALDTLCANAGLYYVGGDGQEAAPGGQVPHPLQIRVANGIWPSPGVNVLFAVVEGDGTVLGDDVFDPNTVICTTDANGIAAADWIVGPKGRQRIEARIADDKASQTRVAFNAQFTDAGGGGAIEPGIRITDVLIGDRELLNDDDVVAEEFFNGITVRFDRAIDSLSALGGPRAKPVMIVTVDVPYPEDFESPIAGFHPVILRSNLDAMGEALLWIPWDENVVAWVQQQIGMAQERGLEQVLAHLVLRGNFIWGDKDPSVFLDGDSFGAPTSGGRTEILRDEEGFMSGDGRRGGDFEMWFWLVA